MNGPPDALEAQIIRSWNVNAKAWARTIQAASILSRKLVTDQAIVDAVSSVRPARVFDVGCGEGWLARALSTSGIKVTGVDAVLELVAAAVQSGGGSFQLADYCAIAERRLQCGPFDAAVCNFSLLGKESVNGLLCAIPHYLDAAGHLIVQTLHPAAACGVQAYQDGWRAGTWAGFGAEFSDPAPWYFRTLASWVSMLRQCGFEILECREPTAPDAIAPASVIFICKTRVPGAD